uniref:alpha-glucosidase n=1 Tax=Plectus sambesii TaxID=2011161 RepID=A0A914VE08_9BILA
MATSDPLMPLSESGKTPQVYQLEDSKNEAHYTRDLEAVKVNTSPKFVGLTKEQLEQYRSDPFWKPMRLILFILFWLAWIGMFAGAVVIVVLSPKCDVKKQASWYKNKVSYQAWTPAFRDSNGDGTGDFKGMNEKLDKLRKIGVQTLWPTPVIQSDTFSYGVTDFEKVDERLGSEEDFKELVDEVHDKEMKLVMDLPITTTSTEHPWFKASRSGGEFTSYYIWRDVVPRGGEEFWAKDDSANKYYLHYQEKKHWPILNWDNTQVSEKILAAAKHWLDIGVDGFYLGFVEYLGRNAEGTQSDWDASTDRLKAFITEIRNYVNSTEAIRDKDIALFSSLENGHNDHQLSLIEAGLNYIINPELTNISAQSCSNKIAPCLHKMLKDVLANHDDNSELESMWELGKPSASRLATRVNDRATAELLTFVQLLLPGAVNVYYGDEIGMMDSKTSGVAAAQRGMMQWDRTAHTGASSTQNATADAAGDDSEFNFDDQYSKEGSQLKMFKKLAKLRLRDEALMLGDYRLGALQSDRDAFAFSRVYWKGDNSTVGNVYVGLVNFGETDFTVDWKADRLYHTGAKLAKGEVVAFTSNVKNYTPRQQIDLSSETHLVGPKQGILFRFAS